MSSNKQRKINMGKGLSTVLGNVSNFNAKIGNSVVSNNYVPLNSIIPNPDQPRKHFDDAELKELTDSIATLGLLSPLTLRKIAQDRYQIIAGERRFRAAKQAGLTEVPAFIMNVNEELHGLELAIVENLQRVDLNPIELAHSFDHLIHEYKYTHEKLAERMSKPRSTITNVLRLLKLPAKIQLALRDGKISEGHARAILSLEDDVKNQLMVCERIIMQKMNVRATEQLCKSIKLQTNNPKHEKNGIEDKFENQQISMFNQKLSNHLGTKTYLKDHKGRGQIIIEYNSQSQLNDLLTKWGIEI